MLLVTEIGGGYLVLHPSDVPMLNSSLAFCELPERRSCVCGSPGRARARSEIAWRREQYNLRLLSEKTKEIEKELKTMSESHYH